MTDIPTAPHYSDEPATATATAAKAPSAVSRALGDAGSIAFSVIDRQIDRLAGALDGAAETVQSIVGQADPALQDNLGGFAGSAADRLRGFADTVRTQDGRALAGKTQQAIARNPAVAIGLGALVGALAMGLVARSAGDAAG